VIVNGWIGSSRECKHRIAAICAWPITPAPHRDAIGRAGYPVALPLMDTPDHLP